MKRPSLKQAIEWIALNDNAGNGDSVEDVARYVTTALVADLFEVPDERVAERIMKVREASKP